MRKWLRILFGAYRAEIRKLLSRKRCVTRYASIATIGLLILSVIPQAWPAPGTTDDQPLLTNAGKYYWCGNRKIAAMNIYHHPLRVVDIHTRKITAIGGMQEYVYLGCSHDSRWLIHQSIGYDPKRPETMGVVYAFDFETGRRFRMFSYPQALFPYHLSFSPDNRRLFVAVTDRYAKDIAQQPSLPWRLFWFGESMRMEFPEIEKGIKQQEALRTHYKLGWTPDGGGLVVQVMLSAGIVHRNPIVYFNVTKDQGSVEKKDIVSSIPLRQPDPFNHEWWYGWIIDREHYIFLPESRNSSQSQMFSLAVVRCNLTGSPQHCDSVFSFSPAQNNPKIWEIADGRNRTSTYSLRAHDGKRSIPCAALGMLDSRRHKPVCVSLNDMPSPDWRWVIAKDRNADIRISPTHHLVQP